MSWIMFLVKVEDDWVLDMGKILQDVMVAMIKDRKRCYEVKQWAPFV